MKTPRTFVATIHPDNDPYSEDLNYKVARILRNLAREIEANGCPTRSKAFFDFNGNDVGRYGLKETS